MAWSAPRTWVTAEVVTASIMNTDVRDNFLVTAPAVAGGSVGYIVSEAANVVVLRTTAGAAVNTSETTASGAYTDLATSGPSVTVTTDTRAFVTLYAKMSNSTLGASCFVSYDITGASTITAADSLGLRWESDPANQIAQFGTSVIQTGLTAGSNVFKLEYKVTTGTGTFEFRRINVLPA